MRIVSIITALVVAGVLFALVLERDRLMEFAGVTPQPAEAAPAPDAPIETAQAPADEAAGTGVVRVMAQRSTARVIDSAVILRGETQAIRQIEVRAETSGKIVSPPLRAGALVDEGQTLCQIDSGTRAVNLAEARASLARARAGVPEASARLAEAKAQLPAVEAAILEARAAIPASEAQLAEARAALPAAQSRLVEARARVPEVEARLDEARSRVPEAEARLEEARAAIPAAEARLREAEANIPAAQARVEEAEAAVPAADARLREAEARVREAEINLKASQELARDGFAAQTRLAGAEAAFESAKAAVETALSGQKSASTAIETAKSQLEGAKAALETARSQVSSAQAGLRSAESGVINARAGVNAAETQIANARAGVQSAESAIEGARAAIESAQSGIEGAKARLSSAEAQRESAQAAIQSAATGEENASAGVQSALAAVAAAEKDIENLTITAPFAGLLETDTAELGALMQPGAACATVIQLDPIKLVAYAPESEIARVETGAQAGARMVDGRELLGKVTFVSRSADPVTRTFRVEITLPNPDMAIRDGQTVEIGIEAEGAPAHLIAQSTLTLNDEGALGVRTIDENTQAQFMPVTFLRDTRNGVWVTGLPDTVDLITVGQEYVTDGVPVAPSFEEVIQ